ncbi:MAG TPA: sigma-70 family RNA polymerase sigma factor [Trebonia sp.]
MLEADRVPAQATPAGPAVPCDDEEFVRLAEPFRRELLVHCYRMLGSLHDAEDLVQETYLRAWRGYGRFEGRSSLRIWLYRIATSVCLTALEHRSRRVLPAGLGAPDSGAAVPGPAGAGEVRWLQPLPDPPGNDPAAIVVVRDSVRLAFIAALQHLSAKQRAVLILRDVMDWHAAEVADLLGTTTIAVNSALRRARAQLEKAAPSDEELTEPGDPRCREMLEQYIAAFETADVPGLVRLLRHDVVLEMPPDLFWFQGRESVRGFLADRFPDAPRFGGNPFRLHAISANGQPAAAAYIAEEDGLYHARAIQVLTVTGTGISHIISFNDPGLFDGFGLPAVVDGSAGAGRWRR